MFDLLDPGSPEYKKRFGFREDYDPKTCMHLKDYITSNDMTYYISTVDLGIDHGHFGTPLYYETMIFQTGGEDHQPIFDRDMYQNRYSTEEEARKAHGAIIEALKNGSYEINDGYLEFTVEV